MKKFLILILFLILIAGPASATDYTTATITVTNTAGTTNGQTITINTIVRTWTNNVVVPSVQILTNSTHTGSTTNLYAQMSLAPVGGGSSIAYGSASNVVLRGFPGQSITVTLSGGWGTVTYVTNSLTAAAAVMVPFTQESAAQQTNIASGLMTILESGSDTNSLDQNSTAASELIGLGNDQRVAGIKYFTNSAGQWFGIVSNSPAISGLIYMITNGVWWTGILESPTMTNGVNYGSAFRSPGSGSASEQFGTSANASGPQSIAFGVSSAASGQGAAAIGYSTLANANFATAAGNDSTASGDSSTAFGYQAVAAAPNSLAIGYQATVPSTHTNSAAIGKNAITTTENQVRLGTASQWVSIPGGLMVDKGATNLLTTGTNNFPAGSDIAFGRYAVSTLANGINDDIVLGTNVNVYVSGMSADFSIRGIDGSPNRDGKIFIIENDTGYNMTIAVEGGALGNGPTAANRITSNTGADRVTVGNGTAILKYNATTSRWKLISFDP